MSMINPDNAQDRETLMDFYQLKTLDPKDYQQDSIQSTFKLDLSTEDLSQIPKEVVNHLLGDTMNDLNLSSSTINNKQNNNKRINSTHSKNYSNYNDALGFHANILDELIDKDILDDTRDPQLNKFMIDSKLFNPKLFLSIIHNDKSLNDLMLGIQNLQNDINSKKPLLQQLITNNFEKTLSSKNSLDKIYNEFSNSNLDSEIDTLNKNLAYSNNSANQLLNPVLLQISKEQELTNALDFISQNRFFLDLPKKLNSYIIEDDFDSFLKEYERGFKYFQNLKSSKNSNPLFDKIWSNINKLLDNYKISLNDDLKKIHIESINSNFKSQISNSKKSNFIILIKRLIELNPTQNPIKDFIDLQYNYMSDDLDKGLAKINYNKLLNARNSILNAYQLNNDNDDNNNDSELLVNTKMRRLLSIFESPNFNIDQLDRLYEKLDFPLIIQLWNYLLDYTNDVTDEVIGKKILKFESIVEFFLNDFESLLSKKALQNLKAYKINDKDLTQMKKYFNSLINKICNRLEYFFSCTTSDLTIALKLSSELGPKAEFPPVGKKDLNDISTFGFIPPNSNSISTICFSVNLHNMIYKKLSEIQNKNLILNSVDLNTMITSTIISINKNIITGCLTNLNTDLAKIFDVDNMAPSDTIEGATKLITFLQNYYKVFISKLHEIYIFNSTELMNIIKEQILKSFDILLKGMVQNVGKQCKVDPSKSDYFYLATVYDMRTLTQRIIPAILKSFDINFQSDLLKNNLELYKKFDKFEFDLFAEYMKEPLTIIKKIVTTGISQINSNSAGLLKKLSKHQTVEVSPYILKSINYINNLKSKLLNFKIRSTFIQDVQSSLIGQLQKKIVDNLSVSFTNDGLYQIVLDMDLLSMLLKKYNSHCPTVSRTDTTKLDKALQKFKAQVDASVLDQIREANVDINYAQFESFITC